MKIKYILTFVCLICFGFGIYGASPNGEVEIVSCYDDNHNEIVGLECERELINFSDKPLLTVLTLIGFVVSAFASVPFWIDDR